MLGAAEAVEAAALGLSAEHFLTQADMHGMCHVHVHIAGTVA